jgi:glucosyltransferase
MKKLTVVVPCYNEEKALPFFIEEMSVQSKNIQYDIEYLFVNDGSKDKTFSVLLDLKQKYSHMDIHIINFSRNFGKEAGMLAGLKNALGDLVVIMDADMQDPPFLLPKMIEIVENNDVDSVATYRVTRTGEPPIRSFFARKFYSIINKISEIDIVDGSRDYRLMTRRMVDAILEMSEYHRFSKGIFVWVGFSTKYLEYENVERVAGETKWSFWKLLMYAIEGIVAFTTVPLRMTTFVGLFISMVTLAYMVFVFVKAALFGDPVAGYPSMMVVILFLGGAQLLSLGILGEYLSKTYMEVKKRPHYIIKDRY